MSQKITLGNMADRMIRRLKPHGFKLFKSPRSPKHTYYLQKEGIPYIRVSDHHLHPNQEKYQVIDVVLNEDEKSVNSKELLLPEIYRKNHYCTVILERVALEIWLYNCKFSMDPYTGSIRKNFRPRGLRQPGGFF